MSKKADRRRHKRRREHQAGQEAQRHEARRALKEEVEAVHKALEDFTSKAADPAVAPGDAALHLFEAIGASDALRVIASLDEPVAAVAAEIAARGGAQRAIEISGAVTEYVAQDPDLVWLAVSLAEEGGDLDLASQIAWRSFEHLEAVGEADDVSAPRLAAEIASIQWRQGRLGDALNGVWEWCARWPESMHLMEIQARLIAHAAELEGEDSGTTALYGPVDQSQASAAAAALQRFGDRTLLYRVRDAVEGFIDADRDLAASGEKYVAEFFEEIKGAAELGQLEEVEPGVAALAAERFWLVGGEEEEQEEKEAEEEEQYGCVLDLFADDLDTPPDLAAAARQWATHVRYGLWACDWDREAGPTRGMWMTDIVTRRSVFAHLPLEQFDGLARWTVLAGALAPVQGVWRSGKSLLSLDPGLADEAAESVLFVTERLVAPFARQMGLKAPRMGSDRRQRPRPHGVLCDVADPMEPAEAQITSQVLGSSLPQLVAMAEASRRRTPVLRNTDGEPTELIRATFAVEDEQSLRRSLLAEFDFEDAGEEGGETGAPAPLHWMGRPMTAEEQANALAQFTAASGGQLGPTDVAGGPQRWLRGILHFAPGQVRVEVNSRARLEAISAKLQRHGAAEASITRQLDPSMDLPMAGARLGAGRSFGAEPDAKWMEHWVTEKVPALEGATPIEASRDPRRVLLLEKLLRSFEYDADLAAASGETPMDFGALRDMLGMQDGVIDDTEEQ